MQPSLAVKLCKLLYGLALVSASNFYFNFDKSSLNLKNNFTIFKVVLLTFLIVLFFGPISQQFP